MRLSINKIMEYVNGTPDPNVDAACYEHHGNDIVTSFAWDNRNVTAQCLFIAFNGANVDGLSFAKDAMTRGAVAILASHEMTGEAYRMANLQEVCVIRVDDTRRAMQDLAREYRENELAGAKVIGITGSLGKTSTKNMTKEIAQKKYRVAYTDGNQNNEIGCPATILRADPETEVLVVEMGMRGLGQIEELCDIAHPDWGVVTNVGSCHLECLGTRENIAKAKSELYAAIPDGGMVFVNAYNPYSMFMLDEAKTFDRSVSYGVFSGSDELTDEMVCELIARGVLECTIPASYAEDIEVNNMGFASFTLCLSDGGETLRERVRLSVPGKHNVYNACAAAAVGYALGVDISDISDALFQTKSESGRQDLLKSKRGFTVIDDTYNASPQSVNAGLDTLRVMKTDGMKVAVLGDMGELGADEEIEAHKKIGRNVAQGGIDALLCVGELSMHTYEAALEAGMHPDTVAWVERAVTASEELKRVMGLGRLSLGGDIDRDCSHDVVLVKASRFKGLEKVVSDILAI